MDVDDAIGELERLLSTSRPVPLSSSIMVNRADVEAVLEGLRQGLPEELRQARWIIKERDDLVEQARSEAQQIVDDAREERDRMLSETEVVKAANREAERIVADAREEAKVLRLEAEDYVDSKLANFEIALHKTLKSVEKGRERLRGRLASDELTGEPESRDDQPQDHGEGCPRDADAELCAEDAAARPHEDEVRPVGLAEAGQQVGHAPPRERAERNVIAVREVREVEDAVGHRETDAGKPEEQPPHQAVLEHHAELRDLGLTDGELAHEVEDEDHCDNHQHGADRVLEKQSPAAVVSVAYPHSESLSWVEPARYKYPSPALPVVFR
ncbi:MAG: hypothetical protein BRC31_01440 [Actinobacteria bacterium QS_5_72_10]|nr:MAG: hypothetical protein BRC31_01440 [Actinobacteria bacterium QS_5_72_10]